MSDFDKVAYWKKRINEKINRTFEGMIPALADIRADSEHAGADPEEIKIAIIAIGDGFNEVKRVVDGIKAPEPKIIVPGK